MLNKCTCFCNTLVIISLVCHSPYATEVESDPTMREQFARFNKRVRRRPKPLRLSRLRVQSFEIKRYDFGMILRFIISSLSTASSYVLCLHLFGRPSTLMYHSTKAQRGPRFCHQLTLLPDQLDEFWCYSDTARCSQSQPISINWLNDSTLFHNIWRFSRILTRVRIQPVALQYSPIKVRHIPYYYSTIVPYFYRLLTPNTQPSFVGRASCAYVTRRRRIWLSMFLNFCGCFSEEISSFSFLVTSNMVLIANSDR